MLFLAHDGELYVHQRLDLESTFIVVIVVLGGMGSMTGSGAGGRCDVPA